MIHIDVDTAVTVPVNIMPLMDDTDFITRETAITYNQAGMDLVWNFITSAGVITQTAVTPTTAGDYDWTHVGDGMYKIEIPASGGASINNDTEGTGYFTGICTGVLAWRSPDICFRAAALNDALIDGGDNLETDITTAGVDAILDEALSGHNVAGSFGKAVRQVKEAVLSEESTVNDASATVNSFITNLTEATDDHYKDVSIVFIDGNLVGQSRPVLSYNGTTKTITLDEDLTEAPADGDGFILKTDHVHPVTQIQSGLATADALTTAQSDLDIVTGTDGALIDSTNDVYHALIEYTFDDPTDEYTVTWFKNGERVTSGITSPEIQVVKRADGTDLVASTAMTQIGSTGSYKYDEASDVISANESYLAVTSATIDSGSRSFACLVGR